MPRHELQRQLRALPLTRLTEVAVHRQCEAVALPEPPSGVVVPAKAAEAPIHLRAAAVVLLLLILLPPPPRGAPVRHIPEEVLLQGAPEVQAVQVVVDNPFTNTF